MLHHLQAAGLQINPKNSKLGFRELDYLGYIIGDGQIKPQTKKIEVILQVVRPQTKKQLRQFLGFIGYYSLFISNTTHTTPRLTS